MTTAASVTHWTNTLKETVRKQRTATNTADSRQIVRSSCLGRQHRQCILVSWERSNIEAQQLADCMRQAAN